MGFEVQAKILELLPEQRGTSSRGEWVRRGFVGETLGEYPKKLQFDVMGEERWQKMSQYVQVGREVKVSFDIDAHEYQDKWFNEIGAWGIMEYVPQAGANPTNGDPSVTAPQNT